MDMEYEMRGPYLIVHVGSELDHHRAECLKAGLHKIERERGIKYIIFDFNGTGFMDSSGVGLLISRYRDLYMSGCNVYASGVCPAVKKLFYVSGLHKIIGVYEKVEDIIYGEK